MLLITLNIAEQVSHSHPRSVSFAFPHIYTFSLQSHSLRCTESFMRDNVVGELGQMQPDDETKQKMLDILKRLHSEEETDSMDEDGMLSVFLFALRLLACPCYFGENWLLLIVTENVLVV